MMLPDGRLRMRGHLQEGDTVKRDMELIREILFWLEENDSGLPEIPEKEEDEIGYHCHLLAEAGFITAADATSYSSNIPMAIPLSLTSQGHDFIDSARSKSVWTTVREKVGGTTGGVSIAILTELLKEEAKRRFGLA